MADEHEQKGVKEKAKGAINDGANNKAGPEFDRPLGSSPMIRST
jgi:hypothetical protein